MDRDLILRLASVLDSKKDNEHSSNIRLQCPMAPVMHARGADRTPDWSVKVEPKGPSPTKCWACGTEGTLKQVLTEAVVRIGGPVLEAGLAFVLEYDQGGLAGAVARMQLGPSAEATKNGVWEPKRLDSYVARCSRTTSQYIIDRGLVAADIQKWQVGYDTGPTRIGAVWIQHRVTFPIWNEAGTLVGASMRTVLGEDPKYRDWPRTPKGEVFYGENFVDTTRGVVNLVEGILDAVVGSRYLPNCMALLGANTGMGPERIAKLRRWCSRVNLILDPDTAGDKAVDGYYKTWVGRDGKERRKKIPGLRDILRRQFVVRVVTLPRGEDPASLREAVVPLVEEAQCRLR